MTDHPSQQHTQIGATPASAQPGTPVTARAPGTGGTGGATAAPQQQAGQPGAPAPRPRFTDWASI